MRAAKLFLAGMYVQLLFSVAAPVGILYIGWNVGWTVSNIVLLAVYLLVIVLVQVLGWISVAAAVRAANEQDWEQLQSGWRTLKIRSIPFHILNFLWSGFVWFCLITASRGVMTVFVPVPIAVTWLLVVQSGIYGILFIRALRRQGERVFRLHTFCQVIPVLDVASTWMMFRRIRVSSVA